MKKALQFIRENKKVILRIIIILCSVTFLVYLFPREGKFKYEYQRGRPWMHEDLIAPHDFPIHKLENEITSERDSILREFKPYFRYDSVLVINQLNRFYEIFNEVWKTHLEEEYGITEELNEARWRDRQLLETEERYKSFASKLLEFVYSKGIVGVQDVLERVDNQQLSIVLMKGKIAEEYDYSEVFTQKSAYEYMVNAVNSMKLEDMREGEERTLEFFRKLNLNEFIEPNLTYDEETSNTVKESLIGEISLTQGMVQMGERIISRGEVVSHQKFRILESLRQEYETRMGYSSNYLLIIAGQIILLFISILVLFLFLYHFRNEIYQDNLKSVFILFLLVLFVFIASMILKTRAVSIFLVPFAIVPIIIRTFYDARLALFIHMITLMIIGFLVPNAFEFVFLNIIAGIVALFSLTNIYRRGKLFLTAVLIFVSYGFVYFGMAIIQEGNFSSIEWIDYAWFAGNSGLILLSYPLIFVFEKTFGFLSDATLMELSDTNQPLLRKLAEKAPGSFQHSLQVSNLAEEAIRVIGGNPLLVRTGALYHDIGKMENPIYFIENQRDGYNPHDALEFDASAEIIIGHVQKGVEMAKKHKLPSQIIDFIQTHHGTTKVQYFYRSYIKKFPEGEVDPKRFSYPGPKPFSNETAVLMMADSVEASSRSLKSYSQETIDELVDAIIDYQVKESQFYDSPITFKNIDAIKQVFKKRLANIYHTRIEYPKVEG